MSYVLELDEPVMDGVRRVGHEQSRKALDRLAALDDLEADVHAARKHCKKLRGLVRLVRPGMEDAYQDANTSFRDAARALAPMRDAHATLSTFDDVLAVSRVDPARFAAVRTVLAEDAAAAGARHDLHDRIAEAQDLIAGGAARIDDWAVDDAEDAARAGVRKSYKRGRNRLADALSCGTVHDRHQWRKRVKYSWYHARLLAYTAPSVLGPLAERLHDLSDALGDDHDLAELKAAFEADPDRYGDADTVEATLRLLSGWQAALQRRALSLGQRLYVETPDRFADRLRAYLEVGRSEGPEHQAGELTDLWAPA